MKLTCLLVDICLPDYWRGHHLPHICVPVWREMTIGQLRQALIDELRQGAIAGNTEDARLLSYDFIAPEDKKRAAALMRAACAAIRRDVRMKKSGARYPFPELEPSTGEDNDFDVHAYFVFVED